MFFKGQPKLVTPKQMKPEEDSDDEPVPLEMRFVGSDFAHLVCAICFRICHQPRQCKHGHLFCFQCLQRHIDNNPSCPACRTETTLENIGRNLVAEKQAENLSEWCTYRFEKVGKNWVVSESGCNETFLSSNLAAHQKQCLYAWVNCSTSEKCGKIRKKNLSEHESKCLYRTTKCDYCDSLVPLHEIKVHQLECKSCPVQCEYCGEELTRGDVATHEMENCLEFIIVCPYGCAEKVKRKDLTLHNKEFLAEHLEFMHEEIHQSHKLELKERDDQIKELNLKVEILNRKIQAASEGSLIQWVLNWKEIEDEKYVLKTFCFEDINLTFGLYPNGDTLESAGFLSLFVFYVHESPRKEFSFFQQIDVEATHKEYIKKLKYYFEIFNFKDPQKTVRSGDILYSLYPNRGGPLMKGERKMIGRHLISTESGFLNEEGELLINLHLDHSKTSILL